LVGVSIDTDLFFTERVQVDINGKGKCRSKYSRRAMHYHKMAHHMNVDVRTSDNFDDISRANI
jgi:hypothetical protein